MAKQKKGGLGKGLDALLSSAPMETTPNAPAETPKPAQEEKPVQKNVPESAPEKKPVEKELPVKRMNPPKSPQMASEAPYEISEDRTTIKGVVSREISPEEALKRKEEKESKQKPAQQTSEPKDADELDINLIQPNPDQPRTNFKKEELEELAESIKKNGLLQPVLVRKTGDVYQIIAGERRYQACKLIGLKKVPVRIIEADDDEVIVLALIENIQRDDLNPIEEAYGYRRMMERAKMTQTQVAQAVSKGRSTIANALRLLELPEEAQELLYEEKITAGHARAILSIPSKENRLKLTQKLKEEQLSVRETEALARLMSGKNETKKTSRPATPKSYKTVARSLREILGTDVRVKSTKDKNKIEITFKDEADLERLYRLMSSD